jgi:hypothetical protein
MEEVGPREASERRQRIRDPEESGHPSQPGVGSVLLRGHSALNGRFVD